MHLIQRLMIFVWDAFPQPILRGHPKTPFVHCVETWSRLSRVAMLSVVGPLHVLDNHIFGGADGLPVIMWEAFPRRRTQVTNLNFPINEKLRLWVLVWKLCRQNSQLDEIKSVSVEILTKQKFFGAWQIDVSIGYRLLHWWPKALQLLQ